MQANEGRIAPIAALLTMLVVSMMIVALAYWSGDLFGPWTSAPAVVEQRGVEALPVMTRAGGGADAAEALRGSRGTNRIEGGMHAAGVTPGGAELPRR